MSTGCTEQIRKYSEMGRPKIADGLVQQSQSILELSKRLGALSFGEYKLTSGGTSSYYFDGRLVTLDPEGAYRVARAFLPVLRECRAEAVAGPAVAAVPIVSSLSVVSYIEGHPVRGLIVRHEPKQHGAKRAIEGTTRPGGRVAVVDDTCSTGASLIGAIESIEAAGCNVVKVMCILDRMMGGSAEIRKRGYDFLALLVADGDGVIRPEQL